MNAQKQIILIYAVSLQIIFRFLDPSSAQAYKYSQAMASSHLGKVLVTGGAGYIGSHTCLELLKAGYDVAVVDNLDNSSEVALDRVRAIYASEKGDDEMATLTIDCVDLVDLQALEGVFVSRGPFVACIHFAGLKAVGESVSMPLQYYSNNINSTLNLVHAMRKAGVRKLVFSSSATVYGDPDFVPITEEHPLRATNPYGRTKALYRGYLERRGYERARQVVYRTSSLL